MASADDLIRVYERRLAEFEARLAAIEKEANAASAVSVRPRRAAAAPPAIGSAWMSAAPSPIFCCWMRSARGSSPRKCLRRRAIPRSASLNGIEKICREAGIDPTEIDDVMHGTTVATNTVLTKAGARVGPRHDQGLP